MTDVSWSEFCGFNKLLKAFCGILANASLFGANTVNEPSPSNVSTKPAALTAVTSVDKLLVAIAASAIVGLSGTLLR